MEHLSNMTLGYRWLGAAGFELRIGDCSLLIDPYVTRIPWQRMLFRRVQANRPLVQNILPRSEHILVTHAHIDHLLDVATVMECTGASVYGSPNTCRLLQALGMPETKIHCIAVGDHLTLGAFQVASFSARHFPVPGFMPGIVSDRSNPPRTARQYRMDSCFSYLIEAGGMRILVDSGKRKHQNLPADVLIIHPFYGAARYRRLIKEVRPKLVIPNHWDNFMAPFSRVIKQGQYPDDWVSTLVRRLILPRFSKMIQGYDPEVKVFIPQLFRDYDLSEMIG
jgi:L-ascorbate metabolism protein UlaG (beta-lactamase superfamily)